MSRGATFRVCAAWLPACSTRPRSRRCYPGKAAAVTLCFGVSTPSNTIHEILGAALIAAGRSSSWSYSRNWGLGWCR
eukprot:15366054-Ditylum_brightwellii.AAC.1